MNKPVFPYTCPVCDGASVRCAYKEINSQYTDIEEISDKEAIEIGYHKCPDNHHSCYEDEVYFELDGGRYFAEYTGYGYAIYSDVFGELHVYPEEFKHLSKNDSFRRIFFTDNFTCKSCKEKVDIISEMKRYTPDIIHAMENNEMTWGLWADIDLYYPSEDDEGYQPKNGYNLFGYYPSEEEEEEDYIEIYKEGDDVDKHYKSPPEMDNIQRLLWPDMDYKKSGNELESIVDRNIFDILRDLDSMDINDK